MPDSRVAPGAAIAVTTARLAGTASRQVVLLRTPAMEAVPRSQKRLWLKLAGATLVVSGIGWVWQPHFLIQLVLLAIVSFALLRSTAETLDLEHSFPELRRLPLIVRLVGARSA